MSLLNLPLVGQLYVPLVLTSLIIGVLILILLEKRNSKLDNDKISAKTLNDKDVKCVNGITRNKAVEMRNKDNKDDIEGEATKNKDAKTMNGITRNKTAEMRNKDDNNEEETELDETEGDIFAQDTSTTKIGDPDRRRESTGSTTTTTCSSHSEDDAPGSAVAADVTSSVNTIEVADGGGVGVGGRTRKVHKKHKCGGKSGKSSCSDNKNKKCCGKSCSSKKAVDIEDLATSLVPTAVMPDKL